MRRDLTEKQRNILRFIGDYVSDHGFPPSMTEISGHFQMSSATGVRDHLNALVRKGFLRKHQNKARALEVVADGTAGLLGGARAPISGRGSARQSSAPIGRRTSNRSGEFRPTEVPLLAGIPLIGRVAAGSPILAEENFQDRLSLDGMFQGNRNQQVFALQVLGDSMHNEGIHDGDIVIVRFQESADNGDIVVAYVDNEATVKRFYHEGDRIRLQPENPNYEPIYVRRDDQSFRIGGRVVGVIRHMVGTRRAA